MAKTATEVRAEQEKSKPTAKLGIEYPFRDRAWICNITPQTWGPQYFDFGSFTVEGCEPGEKFHITEICSRISRIDHGDKNVTETQIGALHIAHDLVRLFNGDIGEKSFMGLLVCEEPTPKKEQLEGAAERLREFYQHCVLIGDDDFQRHQRTSWIPDFVRRAAKELHLEKPYAVNSQELVPCEGCGIANRKGIAKCGHCGAILNEELARKLHMMPPVETPQKEKPQRSA